MALFIRVYQSTSQKQVQLPLFKAVLRREKKKETTQQIRMFSSWKIPTASSLIFIPNSS